MNSPATSALAQKPEPAAVPDKSPWDVPYGNSITADQAAKLVAAVVAESQKSPRNWKMAISVVDPSGDLVYFYKMDQTQLSSVTISQAKARTAVRTRRPTEAYFNAMQTQAGMFLLTLDPTLVAVPGGIPLIVDGKIVGAIGCSGGTGAQDAVACQAGVDMMNDMMK